MSRKFSSRGPEAPTGRTIPRDGFFIAVISVWRKTHERRRDYFHIERSDQDMFRRQGMFQGLYGRCERPSSGIDFDVGGASNGLGVRGQRIARAGAIQGR